MKKFILLLMLGLLISSNAFASPDEDNAKSIAVFIQLPGFGIKDPDAIREKMYNNIAEQLSELGYSVISFEKTRQIERTYSREILGGQTVNGITINPTYKMLDIKEITTKAGAKFGVFVSAGVTDYKVKGGFMKVSTQQTVTCDIRLIAISENEYVADTSLSSDGKSSSGPYGGVPSSDRAFMRAIDGVLKDLDMKKIIGD